MERDLDTQPKFISGYTGGRFKSSKPIVTREILNKDKVPVIGYTGSYRGKIDGKLGKSEVHKTNLSEWEKGVVSDCIDNDFEQEINKDKIPVVGYTGSYLGKIDGKLGRSEVHRTNLSEWDKETVSDILGINRIQDSWDYIHKSSTCSNFIDQDLSVTGSSNSNKYNTAITPIKVFRYLRYCFEVKYKTPSLARSYLKAKFIKQDPTHTGYISAEIFFDILYQTAKIELPIEEKLVICNVLLSSSLSSYTNLSDIMNLSYGKFLNIVTPRINKD